MTAQDGQLLDVKSLGAADLERLAKDHGFPAYRGRQIHEWLFKHGATSFDAMTNVPAALRDILQESAWIRTIAERTRATSSDGTIKLLFDLSSGRAVETVLIPDFDESGSVRRLTVCVSSQVGCAMGCTFCATGRMGFHQDLTASEIADQVLFANEIGLATFARRVTNVVFMGMGEPLLNFDAVLGSVDLLCDDRILGLSPRRITISTVGLATRIRDLADNDRGTNLAVSLHAPIDEKRSAIMPVNRKAKTDLSALRSAIAYYHSHTGRPVTYEYCMFSGFNDGPEDAANLVRVTRWAPSKVNLIMYNTVEGSGFQQTSEAQLNRFIRHLAENDVRVTVRRSRGQDIAAACGQLASSAAVPDRASSIRRKGQASPGPEPRGSETRA